MKKCSDSLLQVMDLKDVCPVHLWLKAWVVATDEGTVEMTTAVKIGCPSIESRKVYSQGELENANNEACLLLV